jgi:hypothetical protein
MSEKLENRAEIAKLARLLGRDVDDLGYLTAVPADDVRRLRDQVTEVLFNAGGPALGRLAAASKLLPIGLVATMGERVFGPVLSARVAGLLEPDRAVEMAARLPIGFLTDVAAELDPRRAHDVIARIPPGQIAEITHELIERGEYVTMGQFVGHLEPAALAAAIKVMDDRALLHVAFVLESKESLRDLIDLLPPGRLDNVIDTAAGENLWPEALDLFTHLSEAQRSDLINRAAGRDDAVLDGLILSAHEQGMWHVVLPLTRLMSPTSLRRFAMLHSIQSEGVLDNVVRVAALHDELWDGLIPVVSELPESSQARVARIVGELDLDDALLARLQRYTPVWPSE